MSDLTYPYLKKYHELAAKHLSPGTEEWVVSLARAAAGGAAYPANAPLPDDHVEEGVEDASLYVKVFNATCRLLGKHLADGVARQVVGVATEVPPEPDDLSVTEADISGLTSGQEALFRWGLAGVSVGIDAAHAQEIYGPDKQPPDYVPKAKRKKWSAMFNSMLKSGVPESIIFGVVNKKYVEKKA